MIQSHAQNNRSVLMVRPALSVSSLIPHSETSEVVFGRSHSKARHVLQTRKLKMSSHAPSKAI